MTPSFCFDAVMLRLAPNRPFFEGWGPNYIHLKHVSRTSASFQKHPLKLRANMPHYRSYRDVTVVPHLPPNPGNSDHNKLAEISTK